MKIEKMDESKITSRTEPLPEIETMSSEDGEADSESTVEYSFEDQEPGGGTEPGNEPRGPRNPGLLTYIRLIVRLLISPRAGWRKIWRMHISSDAVCRGLFYPLVALASLSNFTGLWFDPEMSVSQGLVNALTTFSAFFFGYFLVFLFGKMLLKGKGAEVLQSDFGKTFVAFSMSTLALFFILYSLLPMLEPIIVLLPLWTIFAITRGIKILRIPEEDQTSATVWLSLLIVGLPVATGYIFSLILG